MKHLKRAIAWLLCLLLCTALLPTTQLAFADTAAVPTITLESVIAEPGDDVVLAVDLSDNPGLMAMVFGISYDHTLLTLTGHEDAGLTGWAPDDDTGDPLEDKVLWLGSEDSTFNGTILKLKFKVAQTAGPGDIPVTLTCGIGDVGNHDEEAIVPNIVAGKVHIHGWGDPSYEWSADNTSVTAQRVCTVEASHVETETVSTTSAIAVAATCTVQGQTTYTASFTNPAFAIQTKTVTDIAATGHAYELTGWIWAEDYATASATFTCKNNTSHVQTVNATVESVRTEPTSEADGRIDYTATVIFEGNTYSDTQTEILPALGHDYELSGWTWNGYTAATATFIDKNGGDPLTVSATITPERTEPTCETDGKIVYTASVTLGGQTYTDTKTEILLAIGHDWGEPEYVWAENNGSVTATRVCKNDEIHVETETVNTTSEITKPATCEGKGETTYTAVFTNPAFATQTKTLADVDPIGHVYELTAWSWTGYTNASALFTCKNDATHIVTVEATISSERIEPTTEENGSIVYTARVTFEGTDYTDVKTEVLPALGHEYELSEWVWDGYTAASAIFTDKNGGEPITVEALISIDRTEPGCETEGKIIYTATVRLGDDTYTDTKTEPIPATGHNWSEPEYAWAADYGTVTATRTCKNDPSHMETETTVVSTTTVMPSCEEPGQAIYSADFENPAFETQTKTVELPATGHEWGEPTYVWAEDYSTATASRTCKNDASHTETETVNTSSEVTKEATYEEEGEITYTASFTNPAFGVQTQAVATPKLEKPILENPFVDVKEGAFYYNAVLWAVGHDPQITKGTDPTHFSPDAKCTRGQVVTFLWRAMGCPEPTLTENPFSDVKAKDFYYKAVLWAVENGITTGTGGGKFSPNQGCTRGQVVTFLWRTHDKPAPASSNNPFSDVKAKDYYYTAVLWAVENNITQGTGGGKFSPSSTCTRGQIVTFLYRDLG